MRSSFSAFVLCLVVVLFGKVATAQAAGPRGPQLKSAKTHAAARHTAVKAKVAAAPVVAAPAAPKMVVVKGVVLGPNALALAGASVFPVGKPGQAVVTNEDGEFSFTMPANATRNLQLEAAYAGLGDWKVRVTDPAHEALFITLLPKGM